MGQVLKDGCGLADLLRFAERAWGAAHPIQDGWLTFPDGISADKRMGTMIFVREAYVLLEARLDELKKEGTCHVVVSGNPGLGKSVFALYILLRQAPSLFVTPCGTVTSTALKSCSQLRTCLHCAEAVPLATTKRITCHHNIFNICGQS